MGCFLGCFGDAKDRRSGKQRIHRASSPQGQLKHVKSVEQQIVLVAEQSIPETPPAHLVSDLQNKPEKEERLSPSPKKRVTFNSNIITHEHVSVFESNDSLNEVNGNALKEKEEDLKTSCQSLSQSEDDISGPASVESYPPNHRYHKARDSDDEAEDYGDSDLDDIDYLDDEYCCDDYDEDEIDCMMNDEEVWSESMIISSAESRVENHSGNMIDGEAKLEAFGSKTHARDRRDYVNSVLNPVENITQWKSAKSKVNTNPLKPQKENITSCIETPNILFTTEPTIKQPMFGVEKKHGKWKNSDQEVAVDASLSNWLVHPDKTLSKDTCPSGIEPMTVSKQSDSVRSFEDRPILGALTVDELKQISVTSSPKKFD